MAGNGGGGQRARTTARNLAPSVSRFIVIIPVFSLYVGAVTLALIGAFDTVETIAHILGREYEEKQAIVAFIELADIFLLSIVLYIIAIGLYELFIDADVVLPSWLAFHDIDDLKHRLASVVIVVLAVMFLGTSLQARNAMDVLLRGAGTGLVVFPLAYFLRSGHLQHTSSGQEQEEGDAA